MEEQFLTLEESELLLPTIDFGEPRPVRLQFCDNEGGAFAGFDEQEDGTIQFWVREDVRVTKAAENFLEILDQSFGIKVKIESVSPVDEGHLDQENSEV